MRSVPPHPRRKGFARPQTWQEVEVELRALADDDYAPLDEPVIDAVVGLRLLGYPTIGSCSGHLELDEIGEELYPHIGMRYLMPMRFLRGDGPGGSSMLWNDPRTASPRERHYLALLAWTVYRPMAFQLRELLDECASAQGRSESLFTARADWAGATIEPRVGWRIELTPENLARYQNELYELGAFLRGRLYR